MSLDENIVSVVQAIGAEIKDVRADMALISGGGGTQNVFIQSSEPTILQGTKALWLQTNADGSIMFNLVEGL